jgi:hypothetical protein
MLSPLGAVPFQATMTTLLAILILIDFMFMDDSSFLFEPDVKVGCCSFAFALSGPALLVRFRFPAELGKKNAGSLLK